MCGITRPQDARAAIEQGADALGFVFYEASPRHISIPDAVQIMELISPFINKVALVVNSSSENVFELLKALPVDTLQFHGDETPEFCRQFNKPYLKAIRMQRETSLQEMAERYYDAAGLLVDAFDPSTYGGTGQSFDWKLLPDQCTLPIVLAGGLNSQNVAQAILQAKPYAVDVSSGIESGKGIKDSQKISAFMNEVRRVTE